MKKKALTVILPLCVAMVITACGGKVDTAEVEETTVIEESTEDDEQGEVEAPTMDEEAEVVEAEVTVDKEPEEVVEVYDPAAKYEGKFYSVEQYVLDNDKCDEYGIYSESCFDLDQYLDEEGKLPGTDDWENTDWDYYSGRWAYPEIMQSDTFNDMYLNHRSDRFERFYFTDKLGNETGLFIGSGRDRYDMYVDMAESSKGSEFMQFYYKIVFTVDTIDGPVDVARRVNKYDGYDGSRFNRDYALKTGNFTIVIECAETAEDEDPIEMTAEEVQEIVDNIRLTNGLER